MFSSHLLLLQVGGVPDGHPGVVQSQEGVMTVDPVQVTNSYRRDLQLEGRCY